MILKEFGSKYCLFNRGKKISEDKWEVSENGRKTNLDMEWLSEA